VVTSEAVAELEKLKKKNAKQKVDLDKMKTSIEIKDEMINDMRQELLELRSGTEVTEVQPGEEELSDYLQRAAKFQGSK